MDIQKIRDLLEKARFELPIISTNIPTRKLIGEVLDLIEQQPTASEFTKTIRHNLRIQSRAGDTHRLGNIYAELLKKACDRLDTAEARLKVIPDLLEGCEKFKHYYINIAANGDILWLKNFADIEAAIAKATKEG